jgi:ACS family hexuronate transporter-like MFS transporter
MTAAPPVRKIDLRWLICFLLFAATTINYLDRQILSLLKPVLDHELHWTNAQYGMINSSFLAAYAVSLLFFGRFIDRVGVKTSYAVAIIAWSLAAAAHALVGTVSGFFVARIFLGLSEAGNFPAAVKTVALWFPKTERAFATAIFNSGANVGAVVAPILVPWLTLRYSWHAPFLVAGALGLVWVLVWLIVYAPPRALETSPELAADPAEDATPVPWPRLLKTPRAWSFIVAKTLTDPVWFFLLIWLPDYFKKARGLDIKASWPHLMTIYLIVTALSLVGGWMPGRLVRRGWSVTTARKFSLACFALLVLPILAVSQAGDWTAVCLIGLAGAAHQAWTANLYTTVSDMFPYRAIATVISLGTMAGSLSSMLFIALAGEILDHFGQKDAHGSYELLFGYCSCAYLVAFALNHLLAPNYEPVNLNRNES